MTSILGNHSWGAIKASGVTTFEMTLEGVLLRFYNHPNGTWVGIIGGTNSQSRETFATKREAWDVTRRRAMELATLMRQQGNLSQIPCAYQPRISY